MTTQNNEGKRVIFNFTRSPFFRVVHANGIWGGITPTGELQVAFFVDRDPYPQRVINTIQNGTVGTEIDRRPLAPDDSGVNVERELQVEVRLSLELAVTMQAWLANYTEQLRTIIEQAQTPTADAEH